ncbi:MAG TPA: pitrilysin family protein [Terriglobales bacterium]|jgi:predicted Zn-dependent peptidase
MTSLRPVLIPALALAWALAFSTAVVAQKKSLPLPPAPDMSQMPAVGPAPAYAPPRSQADQLPNGLKIVVVEDHRFPLVSVRLGLRAGSTRLTPATAGLAEAEAELLTAGVPNLSALQIAQATDAMGGSISASAGPDFLTISGHALSSHAQDLIQLMSQVVLQPTFPESEVALRKANMEQELISNRADPGFLAQVQFNKLLFGANPYAITAPTEASIAAITRAALVKFHQQYFLPNNETEIVVVGDIAAARAHNLVQQYFGDWQLGNPTPPVLPPVAAPAARRIALIERPNSAQSTIFLGNLGLTRAAPHYFPFLVANEVLGGSFNSRLMADLREKRGYTYGIGSSNVPNLELGAWIVSMQVRTAVTAPALQAALADMDAMRAAPATPTELTQAKNYLTGNFVLGLQTQSQVAGEFLTTGLYRLPADRLATWVSDVESVAGAEAHAAALANIHPDQDLVVVVGDVKQIESTLAPLAPGTTMNIYNDKGDVVGHYPAAATPAAH